MLQELLSSRNARAVTLTALLSVVPSAAEAKKPEYPLRPIPAVSYPRENPAESNYLGLPAWTEPVHKLGSLDYLLITASPQPKRPCYLDYGEECLKDKTNTQKVSPEHRSFSSPESSQENTSKNTNKIWGGILLGAGILTLGFIGVAAYANSKREGPTGYYCSPSNLNCETKIPIQKESSSAMSSIDWIYVSCGSIAVGSGIYLLVRD